MEENKQPVEYEERNASLDPDEDPAQKLSEDELQERILEDSNMSAFQKFIARLDDAKWKLYQRIFGVVLGLGSAAALFWPGQGEEGSNIGTYSLIIAVAIALLIPNILEKRGGRKMPQARYAMAITLGIAIVAFFIFTGVKYDFNFIQK